MKICVTCHNQLNDEATFCPACGTPVQVQQAAPQQQTYNQQNYQQGYQQGYGQAPYGQVPYAPPVAPDPYDHTAEFDPKDISENKVISMLVYLLGVAGILIALLASNTSKYAAFHVRQALKFVVVETLMWVIAGVTAVLILPLAIAGIMSVVFTVIKIICFFSICSGKAKEPAIIRGLSFLK